MVKKSVIAGMAALLFSACAVDPYTGETRVANAGWGSMIGAAGGAAIGALTSSKKNRSKNALIGAGIGAIAGTGVGAYMDAQNDKLAAELRSTGVSVSKDANNNITLNMPGDITFATNSSDINSNFYPVLNSIGKVLVEYGKTTVDISGHADSSGNDSINRPLSKARADSVARYLEGRGVQSVRIMTYGYSSDYPIDTNSTTAGKARNRRVEIKLVPIT